MCGFSGGIPTNMNIPAGSEVTVTVEGVIEGFGKVSGSQKLTL